MKKLLEEINEIAAVHAADAEVDRSYREKAAAAAAVLETAESDPEGYTAEQILAAKTELDHANLVIAVRAKQCRNAAVKIRAIIDRARPVYGSLVEKYRTAFSSAMKRHLAGLVLEEDLENLIERSPFLRVIVDRGCSLENQRWQRPIADTESPTVLADFANQIAGAAADVEARLAALSRGELLEITRSSAADFYSAGVLDRIVRKGIKLAA